MDEMVVIVRVLIKLRGWLLLLLGTQIGLVTLVKRFGVWYQGWVYWMQSEAGPWLGIIKLCIVLRIAPTPCAACRWSDD